MTTIEKIEKGIITLAEFTEDQKSFIRGIVKLSFNEGQEQALRIHDVVGRSEHLVCQCEKDFESMRNKRYCPKFCRIIGKAN
jgi:hypothetical protein